MVRKAEIIKNEFLEIRSNLEEHLSAINENTTEIQAVFDHLQKMENKIDKLTVRLDQLQLGHNCSLNNKPVITPLNQIEKKIFLTLYTEELPLSSREIANRSQLLISVTNEAINNLSNKGIPLIRTFVNNQSFVKIDPTFKEIQAKENLINLSLESFM